MATVKKDMDMLNGSMWKNILLFAVPIALASIIQHLFHSADLAVVGRFCGKNELAAVGSNGSIIQLLINVIMGLSTGSNVVIAQLLGAGKLKTAKKAVHTSLSVAIICGIITAFLGITLSPLLLKLISSPPDVIGLATIYLRIYFIGAPFIMVYNFSSAILRSRGETIKPFFCLVISGATNVILNLIFVIVFKMGVYGVGVATTVSNILNCIMILSIITKDKGPLGVNLKNIKFDRFIFSRIFKIGFPMCIQSCFFPMSNMMIQSAVNSLGTTFIAGNAAGTSIEAFCYVIEGAFANTIISFVSQNYGAKKIDRCKKAVRECMVLGLVVCSIFNLCMFLLKNPIISAFTADSQVAHYASYRLNFTFICFPVVLFMDLIIQALRGYGHSAFPSVVSLFGVFALRMIWLYTVFNNTNTYLSILLTYPVSWAFVGIVLGIYYIIIVKKEENKFIV